MLSFIEIIENKKVSLELQLAQSMKIHNIFNLNLLQKTSTDLLTNQVNEAIPPVIINNKEERKVVYILDARSYRFKLCYWVK